MHRFIQLPSRCTNIVVCLRGYGGDSLTSGIELGLLGWEIIATTIETKMDMIQSVIEVAWEIITTTVETAIDRMVSVIQDGWDRIVAAIKSAMDEVVESIRGGMSDARAAVSSGIDQMVSTFQGAIGRFRAAGASLIQGFAEGIRSMMGTAVSAASDVISAVAGLFPGSPAEYGPLSGKGYTMIRGQHLTQDLASGMMRDAFRVERASLALAQAASGSLGSGVGLSTSDRSDFAPALASAPGRGQGGGLTVEIAPGAIVIEVSGNVDPAEARRAFDGVADDIADSLLSALQRR